MGVRSVLIIDDFMTISINQRGQEDLTKIIFDRDGRLPTLISSQSAAAYWVETLPDRIGADSLVRRLNNGHRIPIGDFDMRKATAPPPQTTKTDVPGRRTPRPGTNYPEHDSSESPEHWYQKLAADTPLEIAGQCISGETYSPKSKALPPEDHNTADPETGRPAFYDNAIPTESSHSIGIRKRTHEMTKSAQPTTRQTDTHFAT